MSPTLMPPFSAGPPASTIDTSAPRALPKPSDSATSRVTSLICTPMRPRVTLPVALSCSETRVTSSIGTANEMPLYAPDSVAICELMPMTSPRILINGPPELPGLTATSLWISGRYSPVSRDLAEMMPAVTVFSRPNGEPIASTHSPTRILLESPVRRYGRLVAVSLSSATSERRSAPSTLALNSRRSVSVTVTSSAPSTTWALVST